MIHTTPARRCITCDKPLRGRSDKKYCDDSCRNSFNNRINSGRAQSLVRNINNALRRNRKILEALMPAGEMTARVKKEELRDLNFNFKHYTHTFVSNTNKVYYYCYEMGYSQMEDDWYLVVKTNESN